MKKLSISLCLMLVTAFGFAQDKTLSLPNATPWPTCINLRENGFIVRSGDDYYCYTNKLEQVWKVPTKSGMVILDNNIVASPTGNVLYEAYFARGEKLELTRYSKDGSVKSKILQLNDFNREYRTGVLCDDNNLYYLVRETVKIPKQKKEDKLVLYTIKGTDMELTRNEIDYILPNKKDDLIRVIGFVSGKIYFAVKNKDFKNDNYGYDIVVIDPTGKILKTTSLPIKLDNGKFVWPNDCSDYYLSNQSASLPDFTQGNTSTSDVVSKPTSYSSIIIDDADQSAFVFGLYGKDQFGGMFPKNEGYFLIKYKLDGSVVWKFQQAFKDELAVDYFTYSKNPIEKHINLFFNPDNTLKLQITSTDVNFSYEFSADGKLTEQYKMKFSDILTGNRAMRNIKPTYREKLNGFKKFADPKIQTMTMGLPNSCSGYYTNTTKDGITFIDYLGCDTKINMYYYNWPK